MLVHTEMEERLAMPEIVYFAELDEENTVINVVASGELCESAEAELETLVKISNHNRWVQTWRDGSQRRQYASIGGKYDEENNVFIDPRPIGRLSWVLENGRWKPPVDAPFRTSENTWDVSWGEFVETSDFFWDETSTSWIPTIVMVRKANGLIE